MTRPVPEVVETHPGAATYRGATVLPTGHVSWVRPDRAHSTDGVDVEDAGSLHPTDRTRRVLGRRLPDLTGYTGGAIPTDVEGTVRVGGPTRAFWAWLALTLLAAAGGLVAYRAHSPAAMAAVAVGYLVACVAVAPWVGPR